MALIEQLERYFPRGGLSGGSAAASRGAFLLDTEALSEYRAGRIGARDQLRAISPGIRIFELFDGPAQWREVESGVTGPPFEPSTSGVFVAYPGKVMTVLAESLGSELYGSERGYIELVNGLLERGVLFHTFVLAGENSFRHALTQSGSGLIDIPPHIMPLPDVSVDYWAPGEVLVNLFRPLNSAKPDLLLANSVIARITPLGSKAIDRRLVWWFHEFGDRDHHFRFIPSRDSFTKAVSDLDVLKIANSESVAEHLFPNRTDLEIAGYSAARPAETNFSRVDQDTVRIGVVGRIEPQKGQELAVNALRGLLDEGLDIELHFFGTGMAKTVARLKLHVSRLQLSERVFFHGFVADIETIYSQLDALVLASTAEAYGRVPQEGGVRGIPIFFREGGYPGQKLMERFEEIEFSFSDHKDLEKGLAALVAARSGRARLELSIKEFWEESFSKDSYFDNWHRRLQAAATPPGFS